MIAVPRVVLVGHDASATGAPLTALAFARWAAASGAAHVEVLLDRGGPLVAGFEAVAPTHVRARAAGEVVAAADALGGLSAGRWARRGALLTARPPTGADVTVVAASVAAWRSAAAVARGGRRLVLWLHELDGVADRVVPASERAILLEATSRIVAVEARVAAMATERWGVAEDRVSVVGSFVDPLGDGAAAGQATAHPPHDVVGVGSLVPRKGADHLVALTALFRQRGRDLRSAWVGGPLDGPYADLVRTDRAAAGLEDVLDLVGPVDDVGPWWPASGVVVHLAREDPAPLVVIEAGLRAIPVVTWDTGGAADLLRTAGLGHLVADAGDLVAVADAVEALLDDGAGRAEAGAALRAAATARTTDRLAPALLQAFTGGRG
ncbi:MAG TPA: glycosyltransferase family 4 protein [Acidimicrobiales bacterium]|nr:glycosyltransferase family 4 protein [Acidimicrobiales bacterium]